MAIMWHMMIEDAILGWKADGAYDLVRFDATGDAGADLLWLLNAARTHGNAPGLTLPRAVAEALEALIRATSPRVEVTREEVANVPPGGAADALARDAEAADLPREEEEEERKRAPVPCAARETAERTARTSRESGGRSVPF